MLYGAMITLPTPATAEILADCGFDWFFIDGEHGPLGAAEILPILQAVSHKVTCIVRVPEAAEVQSRKCWISGLTVLLSRKSILRRKPPTLFVGQSIHRWVPAVWGSRELTDMEVHLPSTLSRQTMKRS